MPNQTANQTATQSKPNSKPNSKHRPSSKRKAQRLQKKIATSIARKAIAVRAAGGRDKKEFLAGAGTKFEGVPSTAGAARLRGFWNSTEARRSAQLNRN